MDTGTEGREGPHPAARKPLGFPSILSQALYGLVQTWFSHPRAGCCSLAAQQPLQLLLSKGNSDLQEDSASGAKISPYTKDRA